MKLSKLVELACSLRDENEMENDPDVFILNEEEGVLCDFDVGYVPEQFDGFETAYPACIKCREVKIENRGVNINKLPVYQVNGTWVREDELMLPPPI